VADQEKSLADKISELWQDVGADPAKAKKALVECDYDVDRARKLLIKRRQSGRHDPRFSPRPDEW
jgi:translation elongation factor EF-Ts